MAFGIFGRVLHKATEEQERAFAEPLQLPCLLVLCGLGALVLWIFGAFR